MLGRLRAHFGSAATWKDLCFLFLKFPLGVAAFVVVATMLAIADALLLAPIYYDVSGATEHRHGVVVHTGINLGFTHIDKLWEALILVPIGFLTLLVSMHIFNALAGLFRVIASALLAENGPAPEPAASEGSSPAPAAGAPAAPLDATVPGGDG